MGRPLLIRLSTTGGHPIFCHFLNRELQESIGRNLDATTSLRAIQLCSVFHNEPMFCNVSQLYEAAAGHPALMEEISELSRADIFSAFSEHDRVEEFLASRRRLYAHDKDRYGMYFGPSRAIVFPRSPLKTAPSSSTTTDFIAEALVSWESGGSAVDSSASPSDSRVLRPQSRLLRQATLNREERGMTAALFRDPRLGLLIDPQTDGALRRALSGLYVDHYLKAFNALQILHLPALSYYDRPHDEPFLSFEMLSFIGRISGLTTFLEQHNNFSRSSRINGYHLPSKANLFIAMSRLAAALRALALEIGSSVFDARSTRHVEQLLHGLARTESRTAATFEEAVAIATQKINVICQQLSSSNEMAAAALKQHDPAQPRVLITTATDTEDRAFKETFADQGIFIEHTDFAGRSSVRYLGVHGGVALYHVRSSAGGDGPSGSQAVIADAIQHLNPHCILSVGICAGLNPKKQALGDIAVSTALRNYEPQRVGEKHFLGFSRTTIVPRGSRIDASALLLDRVRDMHLLGEDGRLHMGLFLSGEKLVDSLNFRSQLLEIEPEAIALEMEGAGITSVADRNRIEWIIIKGICDFAAEKRKDAQLLAANNAFGLVARLIKRGALNATVMR